MLLRVLASSSRRQIPRSIILAARKKSCLARIDVKNDECPFELFDSWLEEAKQHGAAIPFVYSLALSTKSGRVSNRILTVKDYIDHTIVTMLNLKTKKLRDLVDNPKVSMVFYWCYKRSEGVLVARQVRMDACFQQLDEETSRRYFCTQPLYAQLRSIVCPQGEPVEWDELKKRHDELLRQVVEGKLRLEMPEHERACRFTPVTMDFYHAHDMCIGDRVRFLRSKEDRWTMERIGV